MARSKIDPPQYMWSVQNTYPTPANVQGRSQNSFQVTSQSQWPASGAVYGPSKSGLQPPRGIGPQFTRSALRAMTMRQKEANDKQYTTIDPALSPVGQPARSGHSSASFSFRGQHSHLGDGSCCDSTSSSTSSSGHCCICNAMSDSDLIPPRSKRHLAKSESDKREKKFSWATCAPMVGVAFVVASLFLLGISTRLRSHRVAFSLAVTQQMREAANEMHKETSPASDSPATSKLLTEERGNEDTAKTDLSTTTEGAMELFTTSAPTARAKTVAPGLKSKHTKHALKTHSSPKRTSRKGKKRGRKERKKTRAILLQQARFPYRPPLDGSLSEFTRHAVELFVGIAVVESRPLNTLSVNPVNAPGLATEDMWKTIHAIVREELRKLFPATPQPQVASLTDVVREEVQ
ncbi:hypothetical protein HPB51_027783 [Rhipicephalus microplus]|uniref:Transmembrane protein n=1 Tax=Rhipicephalus microplus TaxID=6941 RepID=A0A9J6CZG1_RHIMP|nr:hypothetical protein HPB51_027783 [Rhipicephalus microplus]